MPYIPDATVVTEPVDGEPATTAALEFRTLKTYIRDVILAGFAGKAPTTNPNFIGNVLLSGPYARLSLLRDTQAGGQVSINIQTQDTGRTWQIYNQAGADDLRIFASGYGDILRVFASGDVSISRDLAVGRSVTISGTFGSVYPEGLRISNNSGYLSFFKSDNTTRVGYLAGASGGLSLISETGQINLTANTANLAWDGTFLYSATGRNLGTNTARWNLYAAGINATGDVSAATFHGDGSGLSNLPAGTVTNSQVITALGFTPYNSSNPNGYISGISGSQVTTALGFTPYSNSNPAGYISGINSGNVTAALGFTPYNSSNPSGFISGINGAQVNSALGLTVGTNATGTKTVSTAGPSGTPQDGDLWYQRAA